MDSHIAPCDPRFSPPEWLSQEVAEQLCERLEWLRITPKRILWLGKSPAAAAALTQRYRNADLTVFPATDRKLAPHRSLIERARALLRVRNRAADPTRSAAPLANPASKADLLIGNLLLYQTRSPEALLAAWQELLAPNAPLFFATFGPDTLKEVRSLAANSSWPHFPDMHDLGDLLVRLRYAEPVMDMHYLTISYQRPAAFLADWGSWCGSCPTPPAWLQQLTFPLPVTLELVFGHAWRPAALPPRLAAEAAAPQPIHWRPR